MCFSLCEYVKQLSVMVHAILCEASDTIHGVSRDETLVSIARF